MLAIPGGGGRVVQLAVRCTRGPRDRRPPLSDVLSRRVRINAAERRGGRDRARQKARADGRRGRRSDRRKGWVQTPTPGRAIADPDRRHLRDDVPCPKPIGIRRPSGVPNGRRLLRASPAPHPGVACMLLPPIPLSPRSSIAAGPSTPRPRSHTLLPNSFPAHARRPCRRTTPPPR